MYFKRMFTKDEVKGTRNYLSSQKNMKSSGLSFIFHSPVFICSGFYHHAHP